MKRGLFIDLDGTLADTMPLLRATYQRFLADIGREDVAGGFESINGPPLDQVVVMLRERYKLTQSPRELLERYTGLIRSKYFEACPSPGAGALLAHAARLGWTCAVVTSNTEVLAREWLAHHGLADAFAAVIGGDSVKVGKPSPEPYLLAIERLGVAASTSIAVEDSPAGIASALGAKLRTFAYSPRESWSGDVTKLAGVLKSLSELEAWLSHA